MQQWTVITGPSGVGKSSLIELLLGLRESNGGKVLVNGTEFSQIDLQKFRSQFSFVPQRGYIYDTTVLANVVGPENVSKFDKYRLKRALSITGISFDTRGNAFNSQADCGENGSNLSGGQRQKVQIAKALYSKKPVIVLDEATSAIDPISQSNILSRIKSLGEFSVIMVTHREEIIKFFDTHIELRKT